MYACQNNIQFLVRLLDFSMTCVSFKPAGQAIPQMPAFVVDNHHSQGPLDLPNLVCVLRTGWRKDSIHPQEGTDCRKVAKPVTWVCSMVGVGTGTRPTRVHG